LCTNAVRGVGQKQPIQAIGASCGWRDHPTIDRLELKESDEAVAVFKSSSVILGVKA
jgi:hypothetical protein